MLIWMQALFLVLLAAVSIAVIYTKDILSSIVIYGIFSYFAVFIYLILGAPDVAFTEAVIGVASTVYFIFALKKVGRWSS